MSSILFVVSLLLFTACDNTSREDKARIDTATSIMPLRRDTVDRAMPIDKPDTAYQADMPVVKPSNAIQPK